VEGGFTYQLFSVVLGDPADSGVPVRSHQQLMSEHISYIDSRADIAQR
jgi:hypothetical protein